MHRFRKILYVVEPAVAQQAALRRAWALAEANQAELTPLAVVPPVGEQVVEWPGGLTTEDLQVAVLAERRAALKSLPAADPASAQARIEVRCGRDFIQIIRLVLSEGTSSSSRPRRIPAGPAACSAARTCTLCASALARSGCCARMAPCPTARCSPRSMSRAAARV